MTRLRIAYAGHDFFAPCLEALLKNQSADVVLFLTNLAAANNRYVRQLAEKSDIPVIEGRMNEASIEEFNITEIDLLISAAYFYKIPIDRLRTRYAANVHPSLLPAGRGPNPLPYFIGEHPDACGVSIHELTSAMDRGPLLIQEKIDVREQGVDDLYLKIVAIAPRLLNALIDNIDDLFSRKETQREGSYWPEHRREAHMVSADLATTHDVVLTCRKFGFFGTILQLKDGSAIEAAHVTASECSHDFEPGTVIGSVSGAWIIAVRDGLVAARPNIPIPSGAKRD